MNKNIKAIHTHTQKYLLIAKHEIKECEKKSNMSITWTPIPNLEEPHVQEVAKFGVEEYNKIYKKHWKLKQIQQGWYSLIDYNQTQYRFLLEQDQVPQGDEKIYEAIVSVQATYQPPYQVIKTLLLFIPYFNYSSSN
uniref:Cystatin domain-containing protein n=1 Tax=Cucumis melo TaxID=3656 RepID=A0A9I9DHQ3_CUCME